MRLKGKTVIITGAASGIGRAIALRFAGEGARVVVADLREDPIEGGEATLAKITKAGGEGVFIPCDVASWDEVDALVTATVERWGRLDVIVNNAARPGRAWVSRKTLPQPLSFLAVPKPPTSPALT